MENNDSVDESPPLFRSWNHWYALVLAVLAILILVFYLFGRYLDGARTSSPQDPMNIILAGKDARAPAKK